MQLIITDAWLAKSRAFHLSGSRLVLAALLLSFILMLLAAFLYWRHTQSPEAREARLRTALENHDTAAAEKIVNP